MTTYGYVRNKLCYGCAATVTLAEMFGKGQSASEMMLSSSHVKARVDRLEFVPAYLSQIIELESSNVQNSLPISLRKFEKSVEYARTGEVSVLIEVLTGEVNKSFDGRWYLDDEDWEEKVHVVEATIAEMAAAGY